MAVPQNNYKYGSAIDNCQTPPEATRLLIPHLQKLGVRTIWEPAAGEGLIAKTFVEAGFDVVRTDIENGLDFLTFTPPFQFDCIITNPPFSVAHLFAARCNALTNTWSLLMKDNCGSSERFRKATWIYENGIAYPDYECIVPSRRVSFKMPQKGWFTEKRDRQGNVTGIDNNAAQFQTRWYCKGFGLGHPEIRVPYKQVDRLRLMIEAGSTGRFSERELERIVDWGEYEPTA